MKENLPKKRFSKLELILKGKKKNVFKLLFHPKVREIMTQPQSFEMVTDGSFTSFDFAFERITNFVLLV